jgi:hypothetical protein
MNQARRAFLGTTAVFGALGFLRMLPGCTQATDTVKPAQPKPGSNDQSPNTQSTPAPTDDDEFVNTAPTETPPVEAEVGNAEWTAKAKAFESANVGGVAYTATAPGPFAGKERSHVPDLKVQSDGVAIVVVNHVMDAGSTGTDAGADAARVDGGDAGYVDAAVRPTHYVTTIWIQDDKGQVLFMKSFAPTDVAPPFIAMRIPEGVKTLTAYEHCNLHGVWASAPV